jgi:hypothetical protein
MSSSDTGINVLADYIRDYATDGDLEILANAVAHRRQALRDRDAAAIQPGVPVVVRDIRPKYLVGMTGTVTAITTYRRRRHATIALDRDSTQRLASASSTYRHLADLDSYELTRIPIGFCRPISR